MKIIIGISLIIMGAAMIRYRFIVHNFTGEWGWAEKYLGGQGTLTAIIFIGLLLIGIGAAYPFGAFNDFSVVPGGSTPEIQSTPS